MQTDKEKLGLKGPVKSVQEERAEFKEQNGQLPLLEEILTRPKAKNA